MFSLFRSPEAAATAVVAAAALLALSQLVLRGHYHDGWRLISISAQQVTHWQYCLLIRFPAFCVCTPIRTPDWQLDNASIMQGDAR